MRYYRRLKLDVALALGLIVALTIAAILHRGVPSNQVDLNDGGVWVVNTQQRLLAHLNYQSRTLDGGLKAGATTFDVTQAGNAVLLAEGSDQQVRVVDTANLVLSPEVSLGGTMTVRHGGGTVAITNADAGKVWVMDAADLTDFTPEAQPTLTDLKGPRSVVGVDGTVLVLTADGSIRSVRRTGDQWVVADEQGLKNKPEGPRVDLTAVGDTLVAYDAQAGTVITDSAVYAVGAVVLQQPGAASDTVLAQADAALLRLPLRQGKTDTVQVPESGSPVAPAFLDGCAYAVWSGSGQYVRQCARDEAEQAVYPHLASAKDLSFRINRDVIVLNDTVSGNIYLVNKGMALVSNWDLIKSQVEDRTRLDERESVETDATTPRDPDAQHAPEATPDEFGVRAGTSTTLPVLLNDIDEDGDALTASLEKAKGPYEVSANRGGRSLRVSVPADATQTMRFTYRTFDGQDRSSPATVTLRVRPAGANDAPAQKRRPALTLEEGKQGVYAVLPDWVDPDGDQVFLDAARAPDGLRVSFRKDGTVTVRDLGTAGPGERQVALTVSDGEKSAEGVLRVRVRPRGTNLPPMANADFYTATVGQTLVVRPLANDTDPSGDTLSLTEVSKASAGQTVIPDFAEDTVQFSADKVGTHILRYSVSDGPGASAGEVRIDVTDPAGKAAPPTADNDLALLPVNSSVIVAVLDNDTDPLGGVLVIQGVSIEAGSPLSVEVLDHTSMRVSAPVGLKEPASFSYSVSNGQGSATATVLVLPLEAAESTRPPVANDDDAVVRCGDIVTVPVLGNDYSPSNMELTLEPKIEVNSDKPLGVAFVSGERVRFRADNVPGTGRVTYTVRDAAGNIASAEIRVTVVSFDQPNQRPRAVPVEARVVAGGSVKIPVPLDGIDPDGDSVQIEGLGSAPKSGATVSVERGFLLFKAPTTARATDSFRYTVIDRFGGVGEASVRVGIAPPPEENQAPVAVTDTRLARPGRTIAIPVTANDLDPDGDRVTLVADSVRAGGSGAQPAPRILGQKIEIDTLAEAGTMEYSYDVIDGRGGRARGILIIKVDPKVPLAAPVADDDSLTPTDIAGNTEVAVNVLVNDADPDGSITKLDLSVEAPARIDGDRVVVPVRPERQVILYTITDPDGLTSRAAVIVPGSAHVPPTLRADKIPASVRGGEKLTVDLATYVLTRADRTAILTSATKIKAGPGMMGEPQVVNDKTIVVAVDPAFVGDTSLSFEVTDGRTVEDPEGLKALLNLPVTVTSSGRARPLVRPSEVLVASGEEPTKVDLAPMVTDPDPGDLDKMSYQIVTVTEGFKASIDRATLSASADAGSRVGTVGYATVRVHDGTTDPVEMRVRIRVIASTRPLIQTTDVSVNDARSGQVSIVDLTNAITNPFADRRLPVTLAGTPKVVSGRGQVTADGLKLSIRPSDDFDGQMVVTYVAADATKEVSRQRPGTVRLTVKGRPDAPTGVSATTNASRSATVSWTAGDLRGGVLTGFTVHWAGGSKDCGRQTVCEINRLLKNDVEYRFTVTQTTEAGTSDPSEPSNVVRPDVKPNPPSTPTATAGDTQIKLSWVDGGGEGSKTTSYTIEVKPAVAGRTQITGIKSTSHTVQGLTNGVAYSFRIRAHNKAPDPSDFSGWSRPEVPAGAPKDLSAPRVEKEPASSALPRATVRWNAPGDPNGDSSFVYELRRSGSSEVLYSGSSRSTTVNLSVSTQDQTFVVRATNKSKKWSSWSPASNAVRGFQTPGTPGEFSLKATGDNNTAKFSFTAADGNGARASEIRYRWEANGESGYVTSGQTVSSGAAFPNGKAVTVKLRAISTIQGESAEGRSVSATVNAYGPPVAPNVSCSGGYRSVTCSWNGGSGNGRDASYKIVEGGSGDVGVTGSHRVDAGFGESRRVCIRITQAESGRTADGCGSATAWPTPTDALTNSGQADGVYYYGNMTLRYWRPNSTVVCSIGHEGSSLQDYTGTFNVDGNGSYDGPANGTPGRFKAAARYYPISGTCQQR